MGWVFTHNPIQETVLLSVAPAFTWNVVETVAPFAGVQMVTVWLVVLRVQVGWAACATIAKLKKRKNERESRKAETRAIQKSPTMLPARTHDRALERISQCGGELPVLSTSFLKK